MKTKKRFLVCALVVILCGWGLPFGVGAQESPTPENAVESEDLLVFGSLGAGAFSTDVYHVLCGAGSTRLQANVDDNGGVDGVRIGVCVEDTGGNPAQCTIAPDNLLSGTVQAVGGLGAYYVKIFRSPPIGLAAVESYSTNIQCRNVLGVATPTTVVLVQNQ